MSAFDDLKIAVNNLRKDYSDFTKLDSSDFPSEKTGNRKIFTMGEAAALFEEQLQIIEGALEDEARCIRYVPGDNMPPVRILLASTKQYIDGKDYHNFTTNIENIIPHISSFAMLSMEKMDGKRYSEISNLESTLREIKEYNTSITNIKNAIDEKSKQIENTYNDLNSKLETLEKNIEENQQKSDSLSQLQGDSGQRLEQIQSMYDNIDNKKGLFDSFISVIDERNKDIDNQKEKTEIYEEKLEEYNKEQNELLQEARELISTAKEALKLGSAVGLSAAFAGKEQKIGNKLIKGGWIFLGLAASGVAIYLGWDTVQTELGFATIPRTLMMAIAIGVATFAARQYSQNKSIEFDYAYKSALVGSYPGLADEFEKEKGLRAEYVAKLLDEVLQDPQRRRDKNNAIRSNRKAQAETETPISESTSKSD